MIQFRTAILDDAAPLIALCETTIDACYRTFLDEDLVNSFMHRKAFHEYTALHLGYFQLATLGGELIGCSVCRDNQIDLILIEPRIQGCGLGTQLLEYSETLLFKKSPVLGLKSFANNRRANAFFRRHGWVDTVAHTDKDSGVREILFRKPDPKLTAMTGKTNWKNVVGGHSGGTTDRYEAVEDSRQMEPEAEESRAPRKRSPYVARRWLDAR